MTPQQIGVQFRVPRGKASTKVIDLIAVNCDRGLLVFAIDKSAPMLGRALMGGGLYQDPDEGRAKFMALAQRIAAKSDKKAKDAIIDRMPMLKGVDVHLDAVTSIRERAISFDDIAGTLRQRSRAAVNRAIHTQEIPRLSL